MIAVGGGEQRGDIFGGTVALCLGCQTPERERARKGFLFPNQLDGLTTHKHGRFFSAERGYIPRVVRSTLPSRSIFFWTVQIEIFFLLSSLICLSLFSLSKSKPSKIASNDLNVPNGHHMLPPVLKNLLTNTHLVVGKLAQGPICD